MAWPNRAATAEFHTNPGEQQQMWERKTRGGKKGYIEEVLLELNLGVGVSDPQVNGARCSSNGGMDPPGGENSMNQDKEGKKQPGGFGMARK